jgi:parallel beta-helix repeat protein
VNGKIFLIGGSTEYCSYLPLNEVYDPATDTWSVKTPCPYTISSGASATINGKIYFLATASQLDLGAFIEIYDPAKDQWNTGAQAPIYGGISAAASALSGMNKAESKIIFLDESSSYIYYPENDTWAMGTPNPANVGFPAATAVNGKLHVIGGIKAPFEGYIVMTSSVATHEEYTPNDAHALASDTKIYIKQDGSIEPPTANITSADNFTYSFMSDIGQRIVIQKDNIIINGNGHTLLGHSAPNYGISGLSYGISIFQRNSVAVTNLTITQFDIAGIGIDKSTNIFIFGNIISYNFNNGMRLYNSSDNTIIGNTITESQMMSGILLIDNSNNNTIAANNLEKCGDTPGISIWDSSGNLIYHNNLFENFKGGAGIIGDSINTWDNGFPSGGNYWSDYNGTDVNNDGIGDTPYIIDANNTDYYPLMKLFSLIPVPVQWPTPTPSSTSTSIPEFPQVPTFAFLVTAILVGTTLLKKRQSKNKLKLRVSVQT